MTICGKFLIKNKKNTWHRFSKYRHIYAIFCQAREKYNIAKALKSIKKELISFFFEIFTYFFFKLAYSNFILDSSYIFFLILRNIIIFMEYLVLALIGLGAVLYLISFFRKGLNGDCSCRAGTCHIDCKSKNTCAKAKGTEEN